MSTVETASLRAGTTARPLILQPRIRSVDQFRLLGFRRNLVLALQKFGAPSVTFFAYPYIDGHQPNWHGKRCRNDETKQDKLEYCSIIRNSFRFELGASQSPCPFFF